MEYKVSFSGEQVGTKYSEMFSGVGLIRGEYPIRKHQMWITKPEMQRITHNYVESIAKNFEGHDVWYRTIEMPTIWVNPLDGCDHIVNESIDTVVGLRGIRRGLAFPETFMIELNLIAELTKKHRNLNIIFPFVHDVSELKKAKEYLASTNFRGKIGIMAEIPSTILCLEQFLKEDIDCVTVGLNDLTGFTLASERALPIYNNTHPAIVKLMEMTVEKARPYGVETVVAGKHNPKSISNAEKTGFDAVTVFIPDIAEALKGKRIVHGKDIASFKIKTI